MGDSDFEWDVLANDIISLIDYVKILDYQKVHLIGKFHLISFSESLVFIKFLLSTSC